MSDYLENKLIDHLFRGTAMTQPAGVYVALGTAASDSAFTEIAATGGYARASIGRSDAAWKGTHGTTTGVSSGTGGNTQNAAAVAFGTPSATWNAGADITHFGLYDAVTGGNLLFWGSLSVAKRVYSGDAAPQFAANAISVTLA
jgi:hypothetical protein